MTRPVRGLALPAALLATLTGCSRPAAEPPAGGPPVATALPYFVSADSAAAALAGPGTVVLHVARERADYDAGHLAGARFLPFGAIVVERDGVPNELPEAALLDSVFEALTAGGHARVLSWLVLEGHRVEGKDVRLADVVDAAHALRRTRLRGSGRVVKREDTAYAVVLTAMALLGSAVYGPMMLENAGLASDDAALARFRAWVARVLVGHLEGSER